MNYAQIISPDGGIKIKTGIGSPENVLLGNEGVYYRDTATNTIYVKKTNYTTTGWQIASIDPTLAKEGQVLTKKIGGAIGYDFSTNEYTTAGRPILGPTQKLLIWNTTTGGPEFWNGVSWQTLSGGTSIIDNLLSTSTTAALSANQGRVLNNSINAKETAFSKNNAFNKNFGTTAGTIVQGNDPRLLIKRLFVSIGSSTGGNKKGVSFSYGVSISSPFFQVSITSGNNNDAFSHKVINKSTTSAQLEIYRIDAGSWGDTAVACQVSIYNSTY
jgi:hypothetical protein